jgi:hypothetical protein
MIASGMRKGKMIQIHGEIPNDSGCVGHGMVVETCPNGKPILLHPCLFKMIVWK